MLAVSLPAFASNSDSGQRNAEEEVLPKLNLLCGGTFTSKYDLASLKANNKDIGWDQTSGHLECDEPLRLLWELCQTPEGKALVRKHELREVQCRGVTGDVGRLTVKNGVILVERAYEEREPWRRARQQFQAALKTTLKVAAENPYNDVQWREFRQAPAPVTSTTDYCLVDDEKVKLDLSLGSTLRKGSVKCWQGGAVVIDLTFKDGRKTGLSRATRGDDWYRVERYLDGQRDGLSEQYEKRKLTRQELYRAGDRVWSKEFFENGALKDYSRGYSSGRVTLRFLDEGHVTSLSCVPEARGDEVVDAWCGFKGERVVEIYDGTKKVNAVRTFRDGRMTKEAPGDSEYSARRAVAFDAAGKKQGEERLSREDGTLERVVRWKAGVQDGAEEVFSKDGKKVVARIVWRDGTKLERTEFFLNGNQKLRESIDGDRQTLVTWFDLGAKASEAQFVRCRSGWCEDGTSRRWFENGKLAEETRWAAGDRDGLSKSWFSDGTPQAEARWEKGVLRARKQWSDKGALVSDDEFEEDGSRKLKR